MDIIFSVISASEVDLRDAMSFPTISLYIKQTADEKLKRSILDLWFKSENPDKLYQFHVIPDQPHGTLSGVLEAIQNYLQQEKIIGEPTTLVTSAYEYAVKLEENEVPPEHRIYYHLMNGETIYTDGTKIDWEENVKHIPDTIHTIDELRMLIGLLLTRETIETAGEDGNSHDENTFEYVKNTVNHFFTDNKMESIDYSLFDIESVSDRERLIVKMIDIMTIYTEQLIIASSLAAQNTAINMIREKQNQKKEEADSK